MIRKIVLGGLAQGLAVCTAFAHHPNIEAEAVCADNGATINYRSYSWVLEPGAEQYLSDPEYGSNPAIEISIDGVPVNTGAYVAPVYEFSGSYPITGGDSVVVSAFAAAPWDSGAPGGQSDSTRVYLPQDCTPPMGEGRFTGGGFQIRVDGVRVTRGLTLHCDLLLSNNLEINWNGNQFHMEEHLSTVACTDDPDIIQDPPPAPLDTLTGTGVGRYNGDSGYSIEFTLRDFGEPGRNDEMGILVYETANPMNVILDVPIQKLDGGNLQAHYDQPHR